jgi:hypothetical protein
MTFVSWNKTIIWTYFKKKILKSSYLFGIMFSYFKTVFIRKNKYFLRKRIRKNSTVSKYHEGRAYAPESWVKIQFAVSVAVFLHIQTRFLDK